MSTKTFCLLICLLTAGIFSHAQEFQVPENIKLEKKEDYTVYEKDVIAAAKWLEATQVGKETDKRQKVNTFLLMWITGSPSVSLEINKFALDLTDKNPQLNMMFMAGFTRWVLENNYSKDQVKAYAAGIRSTINLYKLGGDVKKNKKLLTAIEKDKDGQLETWISENIKS
jgi:hypothetical protein